jgi:hypothetical protein
MPSRRSFIQLLTLENRLAYEAKGLRVQAAGIARGDEQDQLLRKARQAETGSHISDWLRSPELQAPK